MPTKFKPTDDIAGREIELRDENDTHLGDITFERDSVLWCDGRTRQKNGKTLTYEQFASLLNDFDSAS